MPSKAESGHAEDLAIIFCPVDSVDRNVSGTLKSTLISSRSSSVVIIVPGATSDPGETFLTPNTPSKGALIINSFSWALVTLSLASDSLTRDSCSSNAEIAAA